MVHQKTQSPVGFEEALEYVSMELLWHGHPGRGRHVLPQTPADHGFADVFAVYV